MTRAEALFRSPHLPAPERTLNTNYVPSASASVGALLIRDVSISSPHKDWLLLPASPRCTLCTTHPLHLDGGTYRADGRVIEIGTHIFVALPLFELQSAARLCFRHYSSIGVSALASQPVPCVAVKDATINADGGDSGALRTSKSWWNGAAMYVTPATVNTIKPTSPMCSLSCCRPAKGPCKEAQPTEHPASE